MRSTNPCHRSPIETFIAVLSRGPVITQSVQFMLYGGTDPRGERQPFLARVVEVAVQPLAVPAIFQVPLLSRRADDFWPKRAEAFAARPADAGIDDAVGARC